VTTARITLALACPACGAPLVERRRQADGHRFAGCSAYPRCRFGCSAAALDQLAELAQRFEPLFASARVDLVADNAPPAAPSARSELDAFDARVLALVTAFPGGLSSELIRAGASRRWDTVMASLRRLERRGLVERSRGHGWRLAREGHRDAPVEVPPRPTVVVVPAVSWSGRDRGEA
jgi:hypothetical protein